MITGLLQRVHAHWLGSVQSTRSAGLLRILVAIMVWARWAKDLRYFQNVTAGGAVFMTLFYVATSLMFAGLFTRVASAVVGVQCMAMVYYYGYAQGFEPWTHHHTRLLAHAALLVALIPAGRSYSIDRWLAVRRAQARGEAPPPERANVWGVRLIALQLSVLYLFTAIDKLNPGFLSGARMQHYFLHYYSGSDFPDGTLMTVTTMAAAWGTVLLELALGVGMLFRRSRRWLVVPGLILHGSFYALLPVSTFSMTMWVLYLAYYEPDEIHALIDRLHGHAPAPDLERPAAS